MKTKDILKQLDWEYIFGGTSQYENLYDFLSGRHDLKEFVEGFYPRSKNKRIIKSHLKQQNIPYFKKHCKKIWNLAKVQDFCDGDEQEKIERYIGKL